MPVIAQIYHYYRGLTSVGFTLESHSSADVTAGGKFACAHEDVLESLGNDLIK